MWESILLAALGGALTIAGAIVGQHWQAKEARQLRREAFEREDRYRLFRDRVEAYRAFHEAASSARSKLGSYQRDGQDPALLAAVREARADVFTAFITVRLIGDRDVSRAASNLLSEVDGVAWNGEIFDPNRWGNLIIDFVGAARKDLIFDSGQSADGLTPPARTS